MQSAFEQALSPAPSAFSFLNRDSFQEDDGNSIDLFKYYMDLSSSQQQKEPPASSIIANNSGTLSLADIESFQSFLDANQQNSQINTYQQSQIVTQQQQTQSLFPFAEAAPTDTSTSFDSLAFPSYPVASGSEVPIDPRWTLQSNSPPQQTSHPVVVVESEAHEHSLPVPSLSSKTNKKRAVSEISLEEASEVDEDEDEDGEDGLSDAPSMVHRSHPTSTSGAAKKRSSTNKKVASTAISNKKGSAAAILHPHALVPVPDWEDRPSKEVYDKLSSKEKRQMRNKISARNFRHRRKAHIDTLEAEINGKDRLIDGLKEEVGTLRSENQGLRADIDILKANWESIAAKISASSVLATISPSSSSQPSQNSQQLTPEEDDLYGTASSLPALSPASSSASTNGDAESLFDTHASTSTASTSQRRISTRSCTSASAKPNVRKDISPSTGGAFWDSNASPFSAFGNNGPGGRAMDVHTTFVPELNMIESPASDLLAGKRDISSFSSPAYSGSSNGNHNYSTNNYSYGGNMNSALNGLSESQLNALRGQFVHSANSSSIGSSKNNRSSSSSSKQEGEHDPINVTFFDSNPFLVLRNDHLQDYRGQLYSKLANNVAGLQATHQANKAGHAVPVGLKPAFFSNPTSSSQYHQSLQKGYSNYKESQYERRQQQERDLMESQHEINIQHVGALATKTLFEKLSGAFWDAFMGEQPVARPLISPQSSSSSSPSHRAPCHSSYNQPDHPSFAPPQYTRGLDTQKVVDVIAGRRKLLVVDDTSVITTSTSKHEGESTSQQEKIENSINALQRQLEGLEVRK